MSQSFKIIIRDSQLYYNCAVNIKCLIMKLFKYYSLLTSRIQNRVVAKFV